MHKVKQRVFVARRPAQKLIATVGVAAAPPTGRGPPCVPAWSVHDWTAVIMSEPASPACAPDQQAVAAALHQQPAAPHQQPKAILNALVRQRWHGELSYELVEQTKVERRWQWTVRVQLAGCRIVAEDGAETPIPEQSFTATGLGEKRGVEHKAAQVSGLVPARAGGVGGGGGGARPPPPRTPPRPPGRAAGASLAEPPCPLAP